MPDEKRPNVCECCQTEFPEGVELLPKLVVTRDERVARELMEHKGEVYLCMKCWFDEVRKLKPEDLAMALLALLQKVKKLESQVRESSWTEIVEKLKAPQSQGWAPHPTPSVTPDIRVWSDSHTYRCDTGTCTNADAGYVYIGTRGLVPDSGTDGNQPKNPGELLKNS